MFNPAGVVVLVYYFFLLIFNPSGVIFEINLKAERLQNSRRFITEHHKKQNDSRGVALYTNTISPYHSITPHPLDSNIILLSQNAHNVYNFRLEFELCKLHLIKKKYQ